ncbi:50S rRNA methyltransferase, partial [Enterococcus faecalis]
AQLSQAGLSGLKIGFDLSKKGIYLASNQPIDAFWCVAALTNLPFANEGLDTILHILYPTHNQEFRQVLKADGTCVKIIP